MEFDLQLFTDDGETVSESGQSPETSTENQTEEQPPIPDELGGLPEEYAREVMAQWQQMQATQEPKPESQEEPQPESPPEEPPITREQYQAALDEANRLKTQLAALQQQQVQPQQPRSQPQQSPQQAPLITRENAQKINQAITAEAMRLSGMSKEDVASLEYADDDDPRRAQWSQAKNLATSNVYNAINQAQLAQQIQAQQFREKHTAAVHVYNDFVQKELAEPDCQAIQNFATNEFFEQLSPNEQEIIAGSYLRVERQIASPTEMYVVKNYYERAKAAYRARGAKTKPSVPPKQQTANLPRSDQLKGTSTTSDGLSASDIEKLLEQDFTTLTPKQQKMLLGIS